VRFAQRALSLSPLAALATGLFLGTLPTFALWSTSGLESMPACLLGFLAFERLLGDPERPRAVQAGLAAAVLALVRADGAVFALLLFGVAGATWLLERRPALLRATAVATSILVLVVALHVAWRVSYYGDFAPNTARVKAGFSAMRLERGGNYLTALLLAVPSIPLAYALSLLPSARPKKTLWLQCQAFLWVNAAYAVWPGGDFMPFGRFLLPSAPFLALLFAGFVAGSSRARPAPALAASGALVALSLLPQWDVHPIPESVRERFHFRWGEDAFRSEHERWTAMRRNALLWSDVGRALALIARPGESLIETRIGAIGYYSGLVILDGFGLVNRELEELDVQPARTTPGHDRRVPIERWLRYSPTYSQPAIVGPLEAERSLDEWNATHRGAALPWQGRGSVRLLARELPEDMGFRRGAILTVYRYE
jgi:hypothetical protein